MRKNHEITEYIFLKKNAEFLKVPSLYTFPDI